MSNPYTPQPPVVVVNAPQPRQSQALPALVNFFLPGLGQLIQGRVLAAIVWWVVMLVSVLATMAVVGFLTTPILWILCIVDAAKYKG